VIVLPAHAEGNLYQRGCPDVKTSIAATVEVPRWSTQIAISLCIALRVSRGLRRNGGLRMTCAQVTGMVTISELFRRNVPARLPGLR
jgi:hypothetical protein